MIKEGVAKCVLSKRNLVVLTVIYESEPKVNDNI